MCRTRARPGTAPEDVLSPQGCSLKLVPGSTRHALSRRSHRSAQGCRQATPSARRAVPAPGRPPGRAAAAPDRAMPAPARISLMSSAISKAANSNWRVSVRLPSAVGRVAARAGRPSRRPNGDAPPRRRGRRRCSGGRRPRCRYWPSARLRFRAAGRSGRSRPRPCDAQRLMRVAQLLELVGIAAALPAGAGRRAAASIRASARSIRLMASRAR